MGELAFDFSQAQRGATERVMALVQHQLNVE